MIKLSLLTGLSLCVATAATWLFRVWPFDGPDIPPVDQNVLVETTQADNIDTALKMMHDAVEKFAGVQDYRCTYLRDEFIDGAFHENHLHLAIRHEPFSVRMEWLSPKNKKGRVSNYVEGKHDNQMIVKEPVFRGLPPVKVQLDPEESKKRKESRHVITEAGLKNAMQRCCKRWENDRARGLTQVILEDAEVLVNLPEHQITRPCRCVALKRPADLDQRPHFDFFRVNIYFDKETGLPIRFEAYDWPQPGHEDGRLVERYTYLDIRTNAGLKDSDFE
jgi:hypothetical protein